MAGKIHRNERSREHAGGGARLHPLVSLAVGRKNHYGSKPRRGTEVAALYYTIFETAKLAGIDPEAYLRAVVPALLMGAKVRRPHEIAAVAAAPA